jgi:hypothetical protein
VPPDDTLAVPTSVPVTVWRLDDRDDDQPASEPGAGFASRLARRLILVYTRRGDTVVDFDHDLHLRDAAQGTGRAYLAITDASHVAELDQVQQPVTLVTVRWPRHGVPALATTVADLFTACRLMTSDTACVIAAVRPTPTGATFADHERVLRDGADAAGFTHLLQITAVSAPGEGDQFLYYATEAEAVAAAAEVPVTGQALHIDLLVFAGRAES